MNKLSEITWRENVEEIIFNLLKKVYIFIICLLSLLFIGICIENFLLNKYSVGLALGFFFSQFFILTGLVIIIKIIKKRIYGDYFFTVLVSVLDVASLVLAIRFKDEDSRYSRQMYNFLCYGLIFMNLKLYHSWRFFLVSYSLKIVLLITMLTFYDYGYNILINNFVTDFYMILLVMSMIIVNKVISNFLLDSLEKVYAKNAYLSVKLQNIFNTMKNPVLSINFAEKSIFSSNAFVAFIKENFDKTEFGTNYLFDEVSKEEFSENYFQSLIQSLEKEDKEFIDKIKDSPENELNNKFTLSFRIKILLLYRIFGKFMNENLVSFGISEYLNIFKFIRENRYFKDNENFEQKGEYKLDIPSKECLVEISWRKNLFNDNEETVDIIINDITALSESQFFKAETLYRKNYLSKMTKDFNNSVNSLSTSFTDLSSKIDTLSKDNSNGKTDKLSNDLSTIQSKITLLNIQINNYKDFCKDLNDFEEKLEAVDIREHVKFSYSVLEFLISQDPSKDIQINLNVDETLPKFIVTDPDRLKQLTINLITNSVKFTTNGVINMYIKFIPSPKNSTYDEVMISVEDTGKGFTKEEEQEFFTENDQNRQQFLRLDEKTLSIGLLICKKILKKLGKNLSCESDSKMTKVSFSLYDFSRTQDYSETVVETRQNYLTTVNDEDFSKLLKNDAKENILDRVNNEDSIAILVKKDFLENSPISSKRQNKKKTERTKDLVLSSGRMNSIKKISIESLCLNLFQNQDLKKYKEKFIEFNKPMIKYLNFLAEEPNETKFILLIDEDKKSSDMLKSNIYRFLTIRNIKNKKIIKLNDGINALNILYFDYMFFQKISSIVSERNLKLMSGEEFYRVISQLNQKPFQNIDFVLLTKSDKMVKDKDKDKENGISNFLKKSCTFTELEKVFSKLNL